MTAAVITFHNLLVRQSSNNYNMQGMEFTTQDKVKLDNQNKRKHILFAVASCTPLLFFYTKILCCASTVLFTPPFFIFYVL